MRLYVHVSMSEVQYCCHPSSVFGLSLLKRLKYSFYLIFALFLSQMHIKVIVILSNMTATCQIVNIVQFRIKEKKNSGSSVKDHI